MIKKIFDYVLPFVSLCFVCIFWKQNLLAFSLIMLASAAYLHMNRSKQELILYLVVFLIGPIAETIAIIFGAWYYSNPNIYLVPIRLFPIWGHAAVFVKRLYEDIKLF